MAADGQPGWVKLSKRAKMNHAIRDKMSNPRMSPPKSPLEPMMVSFWKTLRHRAVAQSHFVLVLISMFAETGQLVAFAAPI
ncbi:methylmalonate-semialdehyde dehydrogenase [Aspergillus luchuensis]|uniref:Methylmalonate-semialdehyde dehydrogenase n=1 Tax=Aspergillus kawachii TaxID=1069201 RepID=A0A146FA50_ASPKA|nr:methylmalonate-semialdehyde dehydrogenase [Aspergillus luchuensis]